VAIERPDPALCGATHHFCSFLCSATSFVALADREVRCTHRMPVRWYAARAYCDAVSGCMWRTQPATRARGATPGTGAACAGSVPMLVLDLR
jgi:hypothetical protein